VRTRLTPAGWLLLAITVACAVIGVWAGYLELLGPAVAGILVLAAALVAPRQSSPVVLERVEAPKVVRRGSSFAVALRVGAERRAAPMRILDQFAGRRVAAELPALRPGAQLEVTYRFLASRRGVEPLGPLLEERRDPFGLVVRSRVHDVRDEVVVHPVVHPLRLATPSQRQRQRANLIPRLSDDPLADFRALREYQPGDDPRKIHWATSARTGTLLVRDFLELRRAMRLVILETLSSTISAALFEEAVEIAASLAADAVEQSIMLTVRTRDGAHPGTDASARDQLALLDLFARVGRTPVSATVGERRLRLPIEVPDQTFVVVGSTSPLLSILAANPWLRRSLVAVRVSNRPSTLPRLPFATLDVRSARQFAAEGFLR
jgi:uncharacterized protein (DUF58 family)